MYAYAHAPLDEETNSPTNFSSRDKRYVFIRRVYGLKGLQNFSTKQMYSLFKNPLIKAHLYSPHSQFSWALNRQNH